MQRCGEVIKTEEKNAVVRVKMANSCSTDCENYGICKKHAEDVCAKNGIGAEGGDRVLIETPDRPVLLYAFITFIVPLAVCLCLAAAGWFAFKTEIAAIIGGVVGVALSALIVLITDKSVKKTEKPSVIVKITEKKQ